MARGPAAAAGPEPARRRDDGSAANPGAEASRLSVRCTTSASRGHVQEQVHVDRDQKYCTRSKVSIQFNIATIPAAPTTQDDDALTQPFLREDACLTVRVQIPGPRRPSARPIEPRAAPWRRPRTQRSTPLADARAAAAASGSSAAVACAVARSLFSASIMSPAVQTHTPSALHVSPEQPYT